MPIIAPPAGVLRLVSRAVAVAIKQGAKRGNALSNIANNYNGIASKLASSGGHTVQTIQNAAKYIAIGKK